MRALVEEGAIGTPRYATIDLWRRPYRLGSANWRFDAPRVGSWVLEEPIHFFDLACWWLREAGRPVSVYARGSRHPGTPEGLWNDMTTVLAFENGAHATVTQTLAICEHHLAAKVVGDTGAALATWDGEMDRTLRPQASVKLFRGQALEEIPIAPSGESFELRAELARFAAACDGREALPITPREAALAVAICWAAEKSIGLCTPLSL
jgi:myo-inositol 2-dehydrogenase/D-chiro-inositol 1-dehydrogenase